MSGRISTCPLPLPPLRRCSLQQPTEEKICKFHSDFDSNAEIFPRKQAPRNMHPLSGDSGIQDGMGVRTSKEKRMLVLAPGIQASDDPQPHAG